MASSMHMPRPNITNADGFTGGHITNKGEIPGGRELESAAHRAVNVTEALLEARNTSVAGGVNGNIFPELFRYNSSDFDKTVAANDSRNYHIAKNVKQILIKGFQTNLENTTRNADGDVIRYANTEANKEPGFPGAASESDGAATTTLRSWWPSYGDFNNNSDISTSSVFQNTTSSVPSDAKSILRSGLKNLTDELTSGSDTDGATTPHTVQITLSGESRPSHLQLWTKRFTETTFTDHFRGTVGDQTTGSYYRGNFTNTFNNVTDIDDGIGVGTESAITTSSPGIERAADFFNVSSINNSTPTFNNSASVTHFTDRQNITAELFDGAKAAAQAFTESIKDPGTFFTSSPSEAGELNKHYSSTPVGSSSVNSSSGYLNLTSITPPTLSDLSETLVDNLTQSSFQHEELQSISSFAQYPAYDHLQSAKTVANTFPSVVANSSDWTKLSSVVRETISVVHNVTGSLTEALTANTSSLVTERLKESFNSTWSTNAAAAAGAGPHGESAFLGNTTLADLMCPNATWCVYVTTEYANVTNGTEESDADIRYWLLFLLFIPLLTIFGNVLVCLSVFKEKSLQHVTNYFIVSLAVADIMVAFLVMPPAVYYEVRGLWMLSDILCDAWVSFDVMFSTASILNLVAISVDRFIAVTQPIKYAKHKNSKRVYVTLALVWVISVAIALPIALGQNYSPQRGPHECRFYNSDFLIWSSMGSFYIPCIIMVFLYWKIFRAIRQRGKKAKKMTRANVIENPAQQDDSSDEKKPLKQDQLKLDTQVELANLKTTSCTVTTMLAPASDEEDVWVRMEDAHRTMAANDGSHVIANSTAETALIDSNNKNPHQNGKTTNSNMVQISASDSESIPNSPETNRLKFFQTAKNKLLCRNGSVIGDTHPGNGHGKKQGLRPHIKVTFPLTRRKTKREGSKEKKATKTLAIVLGVFLFCWVPFFTVNIINAICIRYELKEHASVCNSIDGLLFSLFTWLGYVNSFMNPVIYTVFNMEFRKAFKKLLTNPCAKY